MCIGFLWSCTVQAFLCKWRHYYLGKQSIKHLTFHLFCQPNTNTLCLHRVSSPSSCFPVLSLIIDWLITILHSCCCVTTIVLAVTFCLYLCTSTLTTITHPTKRPSLCLSNCWMVTKWVFWRQEPINCKKTPNPLKHPCGPHYLYHCIVLWPAPLLKD